MLDLLFAGLVSYAILSYASAGTPKKRPRGRHDSTLFDQAVEEWRRKNRNPRDKGETDA